MKKILVVLFAFVLCLGMSSCSKNDESANAPESNPEIIPLKIIDSGYSISKVKGKFIVSCAVKIKNENESLAVKEPVFRAVIKDKDGEVIETVDQTLPYIYPRLRFAYGGSMLSTEKEPAAVEFEMVENSGTWGTMASFAETERPLPKELLKVEDVEFTGKYISGKVINPNNTPIYSAAVSVILKDKDGNLIGGYTSPTKSRNIDAKGETKFGFAIDGADADEYEIQVASWVL